MINLFERGNHFLKSQLFKWGSVFATVYRGGEKIWGGRVVFAATDCDDYGNDTSLPFRVDDILFEGDKGYEPKVGDVIKAGGVDYRATIYGEELYRWDDPGRNILRVHATRR